MPSLDLLSLLGVFEGDGDSRIMLLEVRFGNYPEHLKKKIIRISDRGKLKEILRLILRVKEMMQKENRREFNRQAGHT